MSSNQHYNTPAVPPILLPYHCLLLAGTAAYVKQYVSQYMVSANLGIAPGLFKNQGLTHCRDNRSCTVSNIVLLLYSPS
jgi:hypothetical protein